MTNAKTAWSITDEGHKLDAAHYNADSESAHKKVKAHKDYARDHPSLAGLGSAADIVALLNGAPVGFGGKGSHVHNLLNMLESRHKDYAAKKHEKGENAYNPFGGWLTESRHEEAEKKAYDMGATTARAAFGLL